MTAPICRDLQAALPEWIGGSLAEPQRLHFRRHLLSCPDCSAALAEWRRMARAVEAARPLVAPPDVVTALVKVDRALRSLPDAPMRPSPRRWMPVAGLGALLLFGLAWNLRPAREGTEPLGDADALVTAVEPQVGVAASASVKGSAEQARLPERHLPRWLWDGMDETGAEDSAIHSPLLVADAPPARRGARSVAAVAPVDAAAPEPGSAGVDGRAVVGASTTGGVPAKGDEQGGGDSTHRDKPTPLAGATTPVPGVTPPTPTAPPEASPTTSPAVSVLEGEVVDEQGRPVPGAYLQLWYADAAPDGPLAELTESDAEGRFSLALPAGRYLLHGEAAGHQSAWWGGADRADARPLSLPADPSGPRPRLVLPGIGTDPTPTDPPAAPSALPTTGTEQPPEPTPTAPPAAQDPERRETTADSRRRFTRPVAMTSADRRA